MEFLGTFIKNSRNIGEVAKLEEIALSSTFDHVDSGAPKNHLRVNLGIAFKYKSLEL